MQRMQHAHIMHPSAPAPLTQEAAEKEKNKTGKRRTSAPAGKKSTYVPSFLFLFCFFGAFWGVSRQGEFENTRFFLRFEYVSKKITGEMFFGGDFFSGGIF
jgi:hypothetical protein